MAIPTALVPTALITSAPTSPPLPPLPPGLLDPPHMALFNTAIPLLGLAVILWAAWQSWRQGSQTWAFLFIVNSSLVAWQETIGDWGQHLVYSPSFTTHHLLDWLPLKTPYDPVFMPFAYAAYWTVHAVALLWLAGICQRRWGWSLLKGVLVFSVPINFLWDGFSEGMAVYMGWWTYDPGFGPVIEFERGTKWPLLWPITLMVGWPNLVAYWGGKPGQGGLNLIEQWCGLGKLVVSASLKTGLPPAQLTLQVPRWRFELARFGAWFAVFQLSFFVTLVLPLVLMRVFTGHHSIYVP